MARLKIEGLSEYTKQLEQLGNDATPIVEKCLYEGAKVMADAISGAIDSIPTRSNTEFGSPDNMLSGLTATQKAGLKSSFGITKMSDQGGVKNVKCGFDGYNSVRTKTYPSGQPNQLIARAIESGTSWLQPCHFMSKAVNSNKSAVEQRMSDVCDEEIARRINGGM